MAFALIAVLWASFGHIDVVAVAQGKIVPNAGSKLIQPIETATVKAIHVIDGQAVKAGQMLVELDATMARADSTRTANDLTTARCKPPAPVACWRRSPRASAAHRAAGRPRRSVERVAQEQRILDGQYGEYQARAQRIDAEIAKREAERRSTEEIVRKLEQTVPIARSAPKTSRAWWRRTSSPNTATWKRNRSASNRKPTCKPRKAGSRNSPPPSPKPAASARR
jgi:hemolysin D